MIPFLIKLLQKFTVLLESAVAKESQKAQDRLRDAAANVQTANGHRAMAKLGRDAVAVLKDITALANPSPVETPEQPKQ